MGAKSIQIENVGPIERLAIPLPDSGVVVLRGRNGSGKSHALAAVDSLVSGRGKPPVRDRAKQAIVEGIGARMTIGRSTRRTGEAEVVTLEGRLDISQLVDPGIQDEESADRTRIKALIQLSGAAADPSTFRAILPEGVTLDDLVGPKDLGDDPVLLAARIKRALDAEALRHERTAEAERAKVASIREASGTVDPNAGSRAEADAELQAALVAERELVTRAEGIEAQRARAAKAAETLDTLRNRESEDPTVVYAELAACATDIERLEKALAVARERQAGLRRGLDAARKHAESIAALEKLLADVPEAVPAHVLQQAAARSAAAKVAQAKAVEAESAMRHAGQADALEAHAVDVERLAEQFRAAAQATDGVLAGLVAGVTTLVRPEMGRLVCDTDRGVEHFAELSPGERWRIALQIAAEQLGQGGLATVPQEAWEALDPQNRAEVAEIARRVGVVILTAEAGEETSIQAVAV